MNQKYRLLLNEGFVFFAYGFAFNGYELPAFFFAAIAIALAVYFHSVRIFRMHLLRIIVLFIPELFLIYILQLNDLVTLIPLLSMSSLITADLWMGSSEKAIGQIMRGMTLTMMIFLFLSFSIKGLFYGNVNTCIITLLIFMPSSAGYLIKEIHYRKGKIIHAVSRKASPVVE